MLGKVKRPLRGKLLSEDAMQRPFTAAEPQIKAYDPVWSQVRREAENISAS